MQEQTAVIQIDTSHSSNLIITEKTLGMNKNQVYTGKFLHHI